MMTLNNLQHTSGLISLLLHLLESLIALHLMCTQCVNECSERGLLLVVPRNLLLQCCGRFGAFLCTV